MLNRTSQSFQWRCIDSMDLFADNSFNLWLQFGSLLHRGFDGLSTWSLVGDTVLEADGAFRRWTLSRGHH